MKNRTIALIFGCLFGLAGGVSAQPVFDAESISAAGTTQLSWSHAPVGTPAGVIVLISCECDGTNEVTSVTYGGASLSQVSNSPVTAAAPEDYTSNVYFLGTTVPTANPATVVVNVNATGSNKRAVAITVTAGADTEVTDSQSTGATGANPSVSLTTGAGQETFVAGVLSTGNGNPNNVAPGSGFTEILEWDFGNGIGHFQRLTVNDSGSGVTVNWTANNDEQAAIGIAINQVSGGGGGDTRQKGGLAAGGAGI